MSGKIIFFKKNPKSPKNKKNNKKSSFQVYNFYYEKQKRRKKKIKILKRKARLGLLPNGFMEVRSVGRNFYKIIEVINVQVEDFQEVIKPGNLLTDAGIQCFIYKYNVNIIGYSPE